MSLRSILRARVRGATDRLMRPYVSQVESTIRSAEANLLKAAGEPHESNSTVESSLPSTRFHMALHELRTMELEGVPKGCRQVLSVGAQGRWYFEWFRAAYGDVDRHVGIEAFEPEPEDLPEYATWIENTADQMSGVETDSIDLVFAGQTTEHLWSTELVGFLCEAHRILRAGGLLVVDSPNRLVTQYLNWSHGGHSIEISADEAASLLQLAGFDVIDAHGLWQCVSAGVVMELESDLDDPAIFVRRASSGREDPDACFVWWINARRADREPVEADLQRQVDDLFSRHWPTRVSRGFFRGPGEDLYLRPGDTGRVAATLPFMLHAGAWCVSLGLASGSWSDVTNPRLVLELPGSHEVYSWELTDRQVEIRFELPSVYFALSLVLHADSVSSPVRIEFPIDLRPAGASGAS